MPTWQHEHPGNFPGITDHAITNVVTTAVVSQNTHKKKKRNHRFS